MVVFKITNEQCCLAVLAHTNTVFLVILIVLSFVSLFLLFVLEPIIQIKWKTRYQRISIPIKNPSRKKNNNNNNNLFHLVERRKKKKNVRVCERKTFFFNTIPQFYRFLIFISFVFSSFSFLFSPLLIIVKTPFSPEPYRPYLLEASVTTAPTIFEIICSSASSRTLPINPFKGGALTE